MLADLGFTIYATPGTYDFLRDYDQLFNKKEGDLIGNDQREQGLFLWRSSTPEISRLESSELSKYQRKDGSSKENHHRSTPVISTPTKGSLKEIFCTPNLEGQNKFAGKLFKAHKPNDTERPNVVELIESKKVRAVVN